jgi:hypothetical protein
MFFLATISSSTEARFLLFSILFPDFAAKDPEISWAPGVGSPSKALLACGASSLFDVLVLSAEFWPANES